MAMNKSIPLHQVAKVQFGSGAAEISRYDRSRKVTITASLAGGGTLGQALALVHKLPSFKNMPASVHEMASGDVEIQRDIFSGFAMAIAVAVMLIYAVLVLLFNDFLQPLTIMVSLPMAVGGCRSWSCGFSRAHWFVRSHWYRHVHGSGDQECHFVG
jgi:multidrug efflux pump subunit AcrB